MQLNFKRVLALAPHTDDVEIGCGGLVHRIIREGGEVRLAAFSNAKESLPPGFDDQTLIREQLAACEVLGIPEQNVSFYDYPVRHFPAHRQEILEDLVAINREYQPDLVLMHATTDVHQDHMTMTQEGIRAFKTTSILGYELPHNTISFTSHCMITLSEEDATKKVEAVQRYHSQQHRPYSSETYLRGWLHGRGITIGQKYAEAFEVIRLIDKNA